MPPFTLAAARLVLDFANDANKFNAPRQAPSFRYVSRDEIARVDESKSRGRFNRTLPDLTVFESIRLAIRRLAATEGRVARLFTRREVSSARTTDASALFRASPRLFVFRLVLAGTFTDAKVSSPLEGEYSSLAQERTNLRPWRLTARLGEKLCAATAAPLVMWE